MVREETVTWIYKKQRVYYASFIISNVKEMLVAIVLIAPVDTCTK